MDVNRGSSTRATVLVIDDTPDNLSLMNGLLKDAYKVKVANSGERGLAIAADGAAPDLILLDVMMPGMDGYEVCARLKKDPRTASIPVMFLTAKSDVEAEQHGFEMGAVDYIAKPISPPIVLARVRTHLALKAAADFLRDQNAFLEAEVDRRTREVTQMQDATMIAMTSLAETRDNETGNHIRRTQHYVRELATRLLEQGTFPELTSTLVTIVYKSAPLHDIGKVGIPDHILLKPGKLTSDEFEMMKTHTILGRNAISAAEKLLDSPNSFLACAAQIAASHQEKWDGSGYPEGLRGEAIPLSARIMAVADVYDALISKRVYKPAMTHDQAMAIIRKDAGTHFDPTIVEAFVAIGSVVESIARQFSDEPAGERVTVA